MPLHHDAELEAALRKAPLFSGLDDHQLAAALSSAQRHTLKAECSLFEQGQPARCFFWVRDGAVKLSRLSPAGEEKIIEIISQGQTFAEALMFMGQESVYPVSAYTLAPSEVISFDNAQFLALLRGSVDTCFRLLGDMSRRLHGLVNEIDLLSLRSATSRVVDFLLSQLDDAATGAEFALKTPKQVLASRLSIKPETLSRIFARLSAEGVIRVDGARIVIPDRAALRARAL